jgi:homopolymeric O-antigen transport system permease protein
MYAISDLRAALTNFGGWSYLAAKRIQLENRRTLLGSFWIILSFALTAAGIGFLMSQLQGRAISTHVPYVMFGFAAWNFIQTSVTAGCNVMVTSKPYLLQMKTARSVFPLSLTVRNSYFLLLHSITAAVISAALGWRPSLDVFWVLPAIALYMILGFSVGLTFGLVCSRLRDLGRLIEATMRLAFFFTPVIWIIGTRDAGASGFLNFLITWNPLSYVLQTFRNGLLGIPPSALDWGVTSALAGVSILLAAAALQTMGRRVTYWL